jgi:molybdate/tungstate transport system substrate-binding protein
MFRGNAPFPATILESGLVVNAAKWVLVALSSGAAAAAQTPHCAPASTQQVIIYRAGSLTGAFKPLENEFTCRTGIQVKDIAMGSVDAGRQITAGRQPCDLYAPADYLDTDLFMKPAGYADFNIRFAQGRMVLAYSHGGSGAKGLPSVAEAGSAPFHPPNSIPKAAAKWYEILTMSGVAIGTGNAFLDPAAYRVQMIFQLAEAHYKAPNLYNTLLQHLVMPGQGSDAVLGKQLDFQFTYEHTARAAAITNPDYRYVELPDEVNLSDDGRDRYYRQNAVLVLPGLGTPRSARTIAIPGAHVVWGITLMNDAPNKENAIKFLELLLSPVGTALLNENGPSPVSPALVRSDDFRRVPATLRPLVKAIRKDKP